MRMPGKRYVGRHGRGRFEICLGLCNASWATTIGQRIEFTRALSCGQGYSWEESRVEANVSWENGRIAIPIEIKVMAHAVRLLDGGGLAARAMAATIPQPSLELGDGHAFQRSL